MLAHLLLGEYKFEYKIRKMLFFVLDYFNNMDKLPPCRLIETLNEENYNNNEDIIQFVWDVVAAVEKIKQFLPEEEFQKMQLLTMEDDQIKVAKKEDIQRCIHFVRKFQFHEKYDCGSLELRIMASLFNLEFSVMTCSMHENNSVHWLFGETKYLPYTFFQNYLQNEDKPREKICLLLDNDQHYYLLNKTYVTEISDSEEVVLTVKDWLENRNNKLIEVCQLTEKDFDQPFIENEERKILIAKLMDLLKEWENKTVIHNAYGSNTASLHPGEWLNASIIELFIEHFKKPQH